VKSFTWVVREIHSHTLHHAVRFKHHIQNVRSARQFRCLGPTELLHAYITCKLSFEINDIPFLSSSCHFQVN
jgi:hypothetical protein